MRAAILLAALFAGLLSPAQDTAVVMGRWSIGVNGSIDRCYRTLVKVGDAPFLGDLIDSRDDSEAPRWSYSTGLDLRYSITPRWILRTGFQFSDRGFGTKKNGILLVDVDGNGTNVGSVQFDYHYRFVSVPIMLAYTIGGQRLRFEPSLGIWADNLRDAYYVLNIERANGTSNAERVQDGQTDYANQTLTGCVELPLACAISSRIDLHFGLRGRYLLTRLLDAPISAHLWEVGGLFGATCRF